jgi:hypothetical protein
LGPEGNVFTTTFHVTQMGKRRGKEDEDRTPFLFASPQVTNLRATIDMDGYQGGPIMILKSTGTAHKLRKLRSLVLWDFIGSPTANLYSIPQMISVEWQYPGGDVYAAPPDDVMDTSQPQGFP